jgi:hypothetical protein
MGNLAGNVRAALTLTELSERLAREFEDLPDHAAVTDVFDYLAGAIFSLKNCEPQPFLNRKGGQVANYKKMLSQYLSEIPEGRSPNRYWVSGYYVDSVMLRIAACYDRIPKLILKKNKGNAHELMRSIWGDASSYANWKAVYEEVNKLKHDPAGLAFGRQVGKDEVMGALNEIVSLLEAKKKVIISVYGT